MAYSGILGVFSSLGFDRHPVAAPFGVRPARPVRDNFDHSATPHQNLAPIFHVRREIAPAPEKNGRDDFPETADCARIRSRDEFRSRTEVHNRKEEAKANEEALARRAKRKRHPKTTKSPWLPSTARDAACASTSVRPERFNSTTIRRTNGGDRSAWTPPTSASDAKCVNFSAPTSPFSWTTRRPSAEVAK